MGVKSKVQTAADAIRDELLSGVLQSKFLPSEVKLMKALGYSRPTVRAALTQLRAEGFVESVPGKGWRRRDLGVDPTFEATIHCFDRAVDEERPGFVTRLLNYRADQIVGGVAGLLRRGSSVSKDARRQLIELEIAATASQYTETTLAMEDAFFAALITGHAPNLGAHLAASQTRRVMAHIRAWLDSATTLPPLAREARAICDAIDAHDDRAIDLTLQFVTARNAIYLRLVDQRLQRCQRGNAVGI